MALYYYARKLQMKSPCKCSCCKNARAASKRGVGGYVEPPPPLPPLPPLPPMTSYSSKYSQQGDGMRSRKANGVIPGHFSSETFPRKLPPCCANLSRSTSTHGKFVEETTRRVVETDEDEDGGGNEAPGDNDDDDFGINSCKIHSGNPSPPGPSPPLRSGSSKGLGSNLTRQRQVSEEWTPEGIGGGGGGRRSSSRTSSTCDDKPRSSHKEMGDKNSLGFKGSQLISGRWEALVELAIPTQSHFPEKNFLFAFLLCSRLHHPPHQTLSSVFRHFSSQPTQQQHFSSEPPPPPKDQNEEEEAIAQESGLNNDDGEESRESWSSSNEGECEMSLNEDEFPLLIKFIGFWVERLPHDFRDDRMMQFIRIISRTVSTTSNISSQVRDDVSSILAHLSDKLSALQSYDGTLLRLRTEALIGEPIAAPSVVTICPNVEKMAEQLTLVELERFSYIGPQELVAQLVRKDRVRLWGMRRQGDVLSGGDPDTPHLDAFIAWFKRLSMFVASEICKMSEKKSRVRVIEYWIKVAKECFKIRNFNSLMAILTGLIGAPVARLKKTWGKICCAELVELQTAMDPQSNFSAYRIMYKTAISACSTVPHKESHNYKIIVPYFALLLRDLYNVNSTYPSSLPNGHINLGKYKELAELTREIISWKFVRCQFVKIQQVFNSVQALPIFTEDELMCASYQCEDPQTYEEKEHYVKLRRGK